MQQEKLHNHRLNLSDFTQRAVTSRAPFKMAIKRSFVRSDLSGDSRIQVSSELLDVGVRWILHLKPLLKTHNKDNGAMWVWCRCVSVCTTGQVRLLPSSPGRRWGPTSSRCHTAGGAELCLEEDSWSSEMIKHQHQFTAATLFHFRFRSPIYSCCDWGRASEASGARSSAQDKVLGTSHRDLTSCVDCQHPAAGDDPHLLRSDSHSGCALFSTTTCCYQKGGLLPDLSS